MIIPMELSSHTNKQCAIEVDSNVITCSSDSLSYPVMPTIAPSQRDTVDDFVYTVSSPISPGEPFCSLTFDYDQMRMQTIPSTPEGLRPRRNVDFIRKELGLGFASINPEENIDNAVSGVKRWLPPDTRFLAERILLPPTPVRCSSWHTSESSVQSASRLTSPMSSLRHHKFSSWSTSGDNQGKLQPTAQSPHLSLGQARTAVGAAVAAIEQQREIELWRNESQNIENPSASRYVFGGPETRSDTLAATSRFDCHVLRKFQTPDRSQSSICGLLSPIPNDPTEDRIEDHSLGASPSSRVRDFVATECNDPSINFSSTSKTVQTTQNKGGLCSQSSENNVADFDKYQVCESQMQCSYAVVDENLVLTDSSNGNNAMLRRVGNELGQLGSSWIKDDGISLRNRNQRQIKEELVFAIMERLQDDIKLVKEVEAINILSFDWVVETPPDEEGLLTGFTAGFRAVLVQQIDTVLAQLEKENALKTYLSSSRTENSQDCIEDLKDSLLFCRTIVVMAVPYAEKKCSSKGYGIQGKWSAHPEMRKAIGILQRTPKSDIHSVCLPADASCFSLPYTVGTPVSSNLSIATTLTSTVGSHRNAGEFQDMNTHVMKTNGLTIRHAITTLSTFFQNLTCCMKNLASMSAPVSWQIVDQIKMNYFGVLDLKSEDLIALIESFEYRIGRDVEEEIPDFDPTFKLTLPSAVGSESCAVTYKSQNSVDGVKHVVLRRRRRNFPLKANRFAPSQVHDSLTFASIENTVLQGQNEVELCYKRTTTLQNVRRTKFHDGIEVSSSVHRSRHVADNHNRRPLLWVRKNFVGE